MATSPTVIIITPEVTDALDVIIRDMAAALVATAPGLTSAVGQIMAGYEEAVRQATAAEQKADYAEAAEADLEES